MTAKKVGDRKVEKQLQKYLKELEKKNEILRKVMNQLQEREQKLLDATTELEATNEELIASKAELESSNAELEASKQELAEQQELVLREKNRLQTIIKDMGEGVIVIDENKEIELINDKAVEILGYQSSRDIPIGYKKFLILQLWRELVESKSEFLRKEITLQRPREMIVQVSLVNLFKGGEHRGFVAVLRDITLEKNTEQMKSDFVANVSHEIRTPMAPMKDALSLVLDGTAGSLTEQQKKFLGIVNNNLDRLSRLINDLLDLSKIEAGRMELKLEQVDITALISEIIELVKSPAQNRNISIVSELANNISLIKCDRDRIIQVLMNLIGNSLKFTPAGGKVAISAAMDESFIVISVADTGPGMPPGAAKDIFDRFKQLSNVKNVKGTGLGLSISKMIVEMHGGCIWAESEEGKGSVFKFTLPVN